MKREEINLLNIVHHFIEAFIYGQDCIFNTMKSSVKYDLY